MKIDKGQERNEREWEGKVRYFLFYTLDAFVNELKGDLRDWAKIRGLFEFIEGDDVSRLIPEAEKITGENKRQDEDPIKWLNTLMTERSLWTEKLSEMDIRGQLLPAASDVIRSIRESRKTKIFTSEEIRSILEANFPDITPKRRKTDVQIGFRHSWGLETHLEVVGEPGLFEFQKGDDVDRLIPEIEKIMGHSKPEGKDPVIWLNELMKEGSGLGKALLDMSDRRKPGVVEKGKLLPQARVIIGRLTEEL